MGPALRWSTQGHSILYCPTPARPFLGEAKKPHAD
jgi:hypothetical protein